MHSSGRCCVEFDDDAPSEIQLMLSNVNNLLELFISVSSNGFESDVGAGCKAWMYELSSLGDGGESSCFLLLRKPNIFCKVILPEQYKTLCKRCTISKIKG